MGKSRRMKKLRGSKVESFGSDDERSYANEKEPDPHTGSFFHDEIDEFHQQKEKILLESGSAAYEENEESEEEEVLGVASDSDGDNEEIVEYERRLRQLQNKGFKDELASDVEEEDKGLPDDRAWGSERNKFYGADVSDDDLVGGDGSDVDVAELEEKEALAIQKKMAEQLDDQDFALDIFKTVEKPKKSASISIQEERVQQDLSQLTKREKIELVKKESPELLELIEDYKAKMTELKDVFIPIKNLIKSGELPLSSGAQYINSKITLYMNYCTNISFYMMLKAKRSPVENHPVIQRLVQYRNLIKQLESVDGKILPEVKMILEKVQSGEELELARPVDNVATKQGRKRKTASRKTGKQMSGKKLSELLSDEDSEDELTERQKAKKKKKADLAEGRYRTTGEAEALEYYEMMKSGRAGAQDDQEDDIEESSETEDTADPGAHTDALDEMVKEEDILSDEETDGKRAITYQIAKNKGLMPKRKKEQRNPRVKHKLKFRKAKIRRKGQVREVRSEMDKYGGELSGIRAGVKRSVKLK